jgi:hypothetical protein
MVDNKLEIEEAQRTANYEAVKSNVETRVDSEIAARASRTTVTEHEHIDNIAGNMRQKAINEVAETDREVQRARGLARVSQIVDYVFFIIYGLLTIRLLLELFAARENAGFFKFIKAATGFFYAPFAGIVPTLAQDGFKLALPIIVAIVAYMFLHLVINQLLRIFAHRKTEV